MDQKYPIFDVAFRPRMYPFYYNKVVSVRLILSIGSCIFLPQGHTLFSYRDFCERQISLGH